ncbi:MAG: bifunctional folylpolyglutamate synthase/dihydrofolate synthase [Thermodesulfatator sp.]|nr:MAG: bifunctional folylpolyglutamate synthase/dihydrofolate synthase [Thermodesulfatator sp.]
MGVTPPFDTIENAISYLDEYQFHGFRLGLERTYAVLKALGDPQNSYPTIHVAGSNGKGSVCAAISSVLQEAGYKVGFYSSPHLFRLNERFRLNMTPVPDPELLDLINEVGALAEAGFELSYFEFTTAMAFLWFARKGVQVAVMETGLGGRLDATNVIKPLVSVITNISLEHQTYLGDTIEAIAGEKAGIIKQNVPVILGNINSRAEPVITKRAMDKKSPLRRLGREFDVVLHQGSNLFDFSGQVFKLHRLSFGLHGRHQVENAAVAMATLEILREKGFDLPENIVQKGIKNTAWPGRTELLTNEKVAVLLDGAHNEAGVEALLKFLKDLDGRQLVKYDFRYLLWACSDEGGDKDPARLLGLLAPLFKKIIITEPRGPRKPVTISEWQAAKIAGLPVKFEKEFETALPGLIENMELQSGLVISGSLYLVGPARHKLFSMGFKKSRF